MEKLKQGLEFIFSSYKRTATILFIAALTLAIPFTLTFLGQNQDIRQQASQVCENVAADIILAIDKSGSMEADNAITKAKVAASSFVDVISKDANNRVGLVSYSSKSRTNLDNALTSNFTSVKEKINQLSASGATCIECAIKRANDEISASGRDNFKNAVVLLTDGKANVILSSDNNVGFDIAAEAALKRAKEGFDQNGTVYFTVGLGNEVQTDFLQKIANLSGGKYFAAPTANDLQAIYNQISQIIGKSSISGFVFEDVNSNGILDENETRLTGWTINLTNKANPNATTPIATDESGGFSFSGLCTGEYQLSAVNQSGWTISSPQNNVYDFLLVNGATSTEQNFGVKPVAQITPSPTETPIPTPTCTPRSDDLQARPSGYNRALRRPLLQSFQSDA